MLSTLTQLLTVLLVLSAPASGPAERGGQRPPRPPREAIEACEDLDPGDACGFVGRDGDTIEGSCWRPDADKPLACRPAQPPA